MSHLRTQLEAERLQAQQRAIQEQQGKAEVGFLSGAVVLGLFLLFATIPIGLIGFFQESTDSVGINRTVSDIGLVLLIALTTIVSNKIGGAFLFMLGCSMLAMSCTSLLSPGLNNGGELLLLGLGVGLILVGRRLFWRGRWWSLPGRR
jgi:hypothetical protein